MFIISFSCHYTSAYVCLNTSVCLCMQQEGGLKLTFQKQGLPLKRPLESEEQQYLVRLHELQSASDTGLADITKPQCSYQTGVFIQNSAMPEDECCVLR